MADTNTYMHYRAEYEELYYAMVLTNSVAFNLNSSFHIILFKLTTSIEI